MTKQSYIFISTMILATAVWFFVICSPYLTEKESLESQISEAKVQLDDFTQTINYLPQFLAERELLKKEKDYINSKLYTKKEVINLFDQLKRSASRQRLVVTEITPPIDELLYLNSYIPDSTKPQFLNIGVQVRGSYIEFAKFIKQIESETFFRGINACQISGSKDYNSELTLYVGFKALLGHIGDKS